MSDHLKSLLVKEKMQLQENPPSPSCTIVLDGEVQAKPKLKMKITQT